MRSVPARQSRSLPGIAVASLIVLAAAAIVGSEQDPQLRFQTGIDLVNVSATVTDADGRFVRNLTREDFTVYEDGRPQALSYFSNERVPVSLGIALDTSGSMTGEKIRAAQVALSRFLVDLLGPDDEVFLYRFSDAPVLVQGWTRDRARLQALLGQITPSGDTVLYDTVAESIPLVQGGHQRKKALVVISDGNDSGSRISPRDVRQRILESEVLVYAVGIDSQTADVPVRDQGRRQRPPVRIPFRIPIRRPGGLRIPDLPQPGVPAPQPPTSDGTWNPEARVDESALRALTDDSGGRTEVIRAARDLDPATAGIADELSRQYYLAYPSPARKDGRWHDIRVEVRNPSYHVRARKGYVASAF
jgi:Ca-activated chloride channel homolog